MEVEQRSECEPVFDQEEGGGMRLRKARRLYWSDKAFWTQILAELKLADLGRRLVSSTPVLTNLASFMKPARFGTKVGLHQDQQLWPYDSPGGVTLWLALTEVNPKNGGIWLYPGSHERGLLPHDEHDPWHPVIKESQMEGWRPICGELAPGDLLIWDRHLVHYSEANKSEEDRVGLVMVLADAQYADGKARDILYL